MLTARLRKCASIGLEPTRATGLHAWASAQEANHSGESATRATSTRHTQRDSREMHMSAGPTSNTSMPTSLAVRHVLHQDCLRTDVSNGRNRPSTSQTLDPRMDCESGVHANGASHLKGHSHAASCWSNCFEVPNLAPFKLLSQMRYVADVAFSLSRKVYSTSNGLFWLA